MECQKYLIKNILFFFNLILALSGWAALLGGVFVFEHVNEYRRFVSTAKVLVPPFALAVVGGIILLVAILGCGGVIRENYCMLMSFSILLTVSTAMELTIGFAANLAKDMMMTSPENDIKMREYLQASMVSYAKTELDRNTWDDIQYTFGCCALDGPQDWATIIGEGLVPASCCLNKRENPSDPPTCEDTKNEEVVFQRGCFDYIKTYIRDYMNVVQGMGIGFAIIELPGILLALHLASSIKKMRPDR